MDAFWRVKDGSAGESQISEKDPLNEIITLNQALIYHDIAVKVSLEFENEKLFRVRYDFGNETDNAFSFVEELYCMF